jgi:hypothetical protein
VGGWVGVFVRGNFGVFGSPLNSHERKAAPLINKYNLHDVMVGVCVGKMVP